MPRNNSELNLKELNSNSKALLDELVTKDGIFASASMGWDGPYHAWFGRDAAITAEFIFASLEHGGDKNLALVALESLKKFSQWQGKTDNREIGEELGKIPHEIRDQITDESNVQHAPSTNELAWYTDPSDGVLKNWDTADATPLWILSIISGHNRLGLEIDDETEHKLRAGLNWLVRNIEQYDGLVGFTGAGLQLDRKYSGLHNQSWKDSEDAYQTDDKHDAEHPIKDVLVNAETWAALKYGEDLFMHKDPQYSESLARVALNLRATFISKDKGFMLDDESGLAQAIDGNGEKLTQQAIDQGAVLWATSPNNEVIVDSHTTKNIVKNMMDPAMFTEHAGIRDYKKGTEFRDGTKYHASDTTYWPFMSGLTAIGLDKFGNKEDAKRVMYSYLSAVATLGSNIEMFIEDESGQLKWWSHPDPSIGQNSSLQQAWTAGAVYYATQYLQQ